MDYKDQGPHREPLARRQTDGRAGVNTLQDRAERLPIDRNCYREGEEPLVFTNQLDLDSMFLMEASWDAENAGGGVMGSSLNYDYDETYITRFKPAYQSTSAEVADFGQKLKNAGGRTTTVSGMLSTDSSTNSSGKLRGHMLQEGRPCLVEAGSALHWQQLTSSKRIPLAYALRLMKIILTHF